MRAMWGGHTDQLSCIAASIISCMRGLSRNNAALCRCMATSTCASRAGAGLSSRATARTIASSRAISPSTTASLIAFFDSKKR